MEESEASGSRASPYSRAMQREQSDDTRWRKTREPSGSILDAPTPAASASEGPDYLSGSTPSTPGYGGWNTSNARASATAEGGPTASSSATPARTANRSAEEEDEDVHIAVMALGAMRNLDGRRMQSGLDKAPGPIHPSGVVGRQRDGSNASMSASSITSTAISSPSSTPATELTQASASTCGGSVQSAQVSGGDGNYTFSGGDGRRHSRSFSSAATLADLPSDFEFPAVVRDENGNEVEVDREMLGDADFLQRVSHMPVIRGTLRAYELGKQKSKIVKYGGDLVESSVKAISRPVVGRLGASLGENRVEQLDDFACRQLDRFYPGGSASISKEERQKLMADLDERERTEWAHMGEEERAKRRRAYWALHMEERERETVVNELRQRKGKGKSPPQAAATTTKVSSAEGGDKQLSRSSGSTASPSSTDTARMRNAGLSSEALSQTQMQNALIESVKAGNGASSSRWGSMLVEAGATAGGLSAAMSEESMKSLKYCLQWLQYATAHIEHQITVLRDLIVKLNHGELELTSPAAQNLTQIKGDVVTTIRSVVDVVGKYAGGALPEPARVSVKAFILSLPARWASVNRAPAVTNASSFGGSPASPSFSPAHFSSSGDASSPGGRARSSSTASNTSLAHRHGGGAQPMSAAATAQAANRVLTLAVESLDILRSVTVVVGESLDRAELWMERLRMLGLQRKRQHEQDSIGNGNGTGTNAIEFSRGTSGGGASWESARGMAARGRADSLGGESDLSMGTSASTKRRRIKAGSSAMVAGGGGSGTGSGSGSASGTGGAVGSPMDPTISSGHAGFSAGSSRNGSSQGADRASSSYDQSPSHANARRRRVGAAGQRTGE